MGIIPAYAGLILRLGSVQPLGKDHPRIRGTNLFPVNPTTEDGGSSPHTRD